MEEQPTWVILDRKLHWFTLTPKVVDSLERISNVHQHHLTLTTDKRPRALCGRYDPDDYSPHQMSGTWAMGKGDACAECVRVVQKMLPNALKGVNHLYVTEGQMLQVPAPPPQPVIPVQIWEYIESVGNQVQQAQSAYTRLAHVLQEWLTQQGIEPPPALQTLMPSVPLGQANRDESIVDLFRLDDYATWVKDHPQGLLATVRSPKIMVHRVGCHRERNAVFVPCYAALNGNVIEQAFQGDVGIQWCLDCLNGHNPDRKLLPQSQ